MQVKENSSFGEIEARQILNAGWRQGSIFRPPEDFVVPVQFERDHEVLVVCTQSCTVVSDRLGVDPYIEFLIGRPVIEYKPRSAESTGKNLRQFHLPISGIKNIEAFACDINTRFLVDRTLCLKHTPDLSITVPEESVRNFASWIARYYTRIALPNKLVQRAKIGLYKHIKNALETKLTSGEKLSRSEERRVG